LRRPRGSASLSPPWGTLAAGLAHEINNPAAAAVRAVDALEDACQGLVVSAGQFAAHGISPGQFGALDALRKEASGPIAVPDALTLADLEDELAEWLTRHGVDREWMIAPALAAVKSYTQMDRSSMQRVDVTEGLESTLVVRAQRLRDGVTVVRDYAGDVPPVEAHAGELNQVWTNLIDNAVDAMDGKGTLRLSTRADGGHVVVEIADTGCGMPPQVAARAFEPFFTTKDAATSTGLGLDIARRIIAERHGGTIEIDSRPGHTVLEVRLPVRAPAS
jgi:signal transduction histidine kinase